ncbi:hypothetical protein ACTHAM_002348 [Cellulomonas soli]|uniref:hypothetical protein n=1 Tax=Cellulomonas soli TaxID=931535 RepID=UPI003F83B401
MSAPPEGTPWWVWGLLAALTVVVPAVATVAVALVTRPLRRDARAAAASSEKAAEQAESAASSAAHAATELTPNHGGSSKDALTTLVAAVGHLTDMVAQQGVTLEGQAQDIGGIRSELRTERTERVDLARRLDDHVRVSAH